MASEFFLKYVAVNETKKLAARQETTEKWLCFREKALWMWTQENMACCCIYTNNIMYNSSGL